MSVDVAEGAVLWGEQRAAPNDVEGFVERYGGWSGRAWLEVVGPGWRIPIAAGYGADRSRLRHAFPRLPFTSDWIDGRLPSCPAGLPPNAALCLGGVAVLALATATGALLGPAWAALVALAAIWPLGRLRDHVVIQLDGVRAGPAWAGLTGWHRVDGVHVLIGRRRSLVWTTGPEGGGLATLPTVLVPALRARVYRLGGLEVEEHALGPDLDFRYLRWRGPAQGIVWGTLFAACLVPWFTPLPWTALTAGLVAVAALAMASAAVEARVTGWGTGSVLWLTGVYAVVLIALSLGVGAYLGGS